MLKINIGIIGCGNMAGAIVRGMVRKGIAGKGSILLNDKDISKANALAEETGCRREELHSVAQGSDVLLIAVKPQDSDVLLSEMSADIAGQTVISVMAGVRISQITAKLGKELPVARAMPNMAAFVGESITCVSYNSLVQMREEVKAVFSSIGKVLEVEEGSLDAVTALSGSGPAYLFYLADAMMSAGEKVGLDKATTNELVVQTLYGAAAFMKDSENSPEELIKKVASKGGTTEAALKVFSEMNFKMAVEEAIARAKQRSEELSGG
jgi:pyrroline-5-carboxylate reductase